MTHPAQKWIDGAAKRKRGGSVEGCARGGRADRPGKARDDDRANWPNHLPPPDYGSHEPLTGPEKKRGGKLTAEDRRGLPGKDFALPGRGKGPSGKGAGSYPIPDESHARAALSRGSANASPAELATIKRKVHAKFPGIKER